MIIICKHLMLPARTSFYCSSRSNTFFYLHYHDLLFKQLHIFKNKKLDSEIIRCILISNILFERL